MAQKTETFFVGGVKMKRQLQGIALILTGLQMIVAAAAGIPWLFYVAAVIDIAGLVLCFGGKHDG